MQTMQKNNRLSGALIEDSARDFTLVIDEGLAAWVRFQWISVGGELCGSARIHADQKVLRGGWHCGAGRAQLPGVGGVVDPHRHAEIPHSLAFAPQCLVGFLDLGIECGQTVLGCLRILFGLLQSRLGHQRLQRRCSTVGGADGRHGVARGRLRR